MSTKYRSLQEAFENRKFNTGEVKFNAHTLDDPHIKKTVDYIIQHSNLSKEQLAEKIQERVDKFASMLEKAPILYGTIANNIVEDTVFTIFQDRQIDIADCPKWDKDVFFDLVRIIKAENSKFNPMRNFMSHKRLFEATFWFTPNPKLTKKENEVDTAAATPTGRFYFNIPFMQKLMDFAHIKQIKPKGKKYISNGGDIPDEYCYIEFVIMHEFMHFTEADFHYQKVIPNANPKVINYVGDFRTNYLLVKSGYEQLPMGLFNDAINYDRQSSYKEMYDIVKSELDKLKDEDRKEIEDWMDDRTDDHEPGNEEGTEMEEGDGIPEDEIDENAEKTKEKMKDAKDKDSKDAEKDAKEEKEANDGQGKGDKGGRGSGNSTSTSGIDYDKVEPKYNWAALIKQFISTANEETEETYQKPSRRSISGLHTAVQIGKGAMKPGDISVDLIKAKLCFCIDSSGSMSDVIETVYSNINNLLKSHRALKNSEFSLVRFSDTHEKFKGVFNGDKAAKVDKVTDSPKRFDLKLSNVFKEHYGSVTNFNDPLVSDLSILIKEKYNVLIFSDGDITSGQNLEELLKLLKVPGGKVFIVFDKKSTYLEFRKKVKGGSIFVSYFEKD